MRVLKRGEQGERCYFEKGMRLPKTQLVRLLPGIFQISPFFSPGITYGPLRKEKAKLLRVISVGCGPQNSFAKVSSHFQAF